VADVGVSDFCDRAHLAVIGAFHRPERAAEFAESKRWEACDARTRAVFGLCNEFLCIPFGVLRDAVDEFAPGIGTISFGMPDSMASVLRAIVDGAEARPGYADGSQQPARIILHPDMDPPRFTLEEVSDV
jgi:hypothetical protein